ncbi:hypothetical protein HDU84_006846 [Entophlyctis sp. JEL0112]|nr:hypothetical protein HDU84_006846 [Entophlyctis sp. JEL0112]
MSNASRLAPARSTASLVRAFKGGGVPVLRVRPNNSAVSANEGRSDDNKDPNRNDDNNHSGSDDHLDHNDPHLAVLARHDSLHVETRPHKSHFALLRRTFSAQDPNHDHDGEDLDFEVHHVGDEADGVDGGNASQQLSPSDSKPSGEDGAAKARRKSRVLDVFLKLRDDIHKLTHKKKNPEEYSRDLSVQADHNSEHAPEQSLAQEQGNNNSAVHGVNVESPVETIVTPVSSRQSIPSLHSSIFRSLPRHLKAFHSDADAEPGSLHRPSEEQIEDAEVIRAEEESYRRLKEYKYIKLLGAGAQGTVTLRLHLPTSSIRALKSIPTAPSAVDSHVRESFRREVEILTACRQHPNIIRLIDSWESISTVYQVFDVMNGGDASMDGVFSHIGEEKAVRLIAPIADALRFLHKNSILHRDVRPANIFLRRSITGHEMPRELETIPVLADFGIANYSKNSGRLAAPFPVTPAHIAPEILAGARFTKASDCYGLGYYAMHLLLHKQPTVSDVRDTAAIADRHWLQLSQSGKMAISMLLYPDPSVRLTAAEFCDGDWVSSHGVECVKHFL